MDLSDDCSESYEYDFDHTSVRDLRMPASKYAKLVEAYRFLREALQEWNERVPRETGAEAPYLMEVEDLDRMIHWSDEQFSNGGREVVVRGISVGSLRYAKAAMLHYIHDKQEGRAAMAENGWPSAALRSVDDDIQQLQTIADSISQEPSGLLRDLSRSKHPSVIPSERSEVTSQDRRASLLLPSLSIRGFRGIDALTIPKLGRVTLLSGRNGIGKTTVLDAVRAYAARGRLEVLVELLERREELARQPGESIDLSDISPLFRNRSPHGGCISVGPSGDADAHRLEISETKELPRELVAQLTNMGLSPDISAIKVQFNGSTAFLPWAASSNARRVRYKHRDYLDDDLPEAIACNLFGPNPTPNETLADFWDEVSLNPEEELVMGALRLVLGRKLERVAVRGHAHDPRPRFFVRLTGSEPAPLASFGDGAVRLFGIALTLVRSRKGFLVIDEAENGIHHSVQKKFWRLIMEAAVNHDVQVFATTHSKDCIDGFGRAAIECPAAEALLLRLERHNGRLRAVQYEEDEIVTAAEQGIETR